MRGRVHEADRVPLLGTAGWPSHGEPGADGLPLVPRCLGGRWVGLDGMAVVIVFCSLPCWLLPFVLPAGQVATREEPLFCYP